MIAGMAYCGSRLAEPRYIDAARRAADFILSEMRSGPGLLRSYRDGTAHIDGFLDDYAFLASGLLDLHEATHDAAYFDEARALAERMIERFLDREEGGFFSTGTGAEIVLARGKDAYDKALPSGNGVAASMLVRLARATGERRYLELAKRTIDCFLAFMQGAPRATAGMILAADMYLDETSEARVASTTPSAGQTGP
jgi:hypothetical protein